MKIIENIVIVDGGGTYKGGLLISNGKIDALIAEGDNIPEVEHIDGKGLYASAGFIDVHTHGAGGGDFMSSNPEDYIKACKMHLKQAHQYL